MVCRQPTHWNGIAGADIDPIFTGIPPPELDQGLGRPVTPSPPASSNPIILCDVASRKQTWQRRDDGD